MPLLPGTLQEMGFKAVNAMSTAMLIFSLAATVIGLGPETRGRKFAT